MLARLVNTDDHSGSAAVVTEAANELRVRAEELARAECEAEESAQQIISDLSSMAANEEVTLQALQQRRVAVAGTATLANFVSVRQQLMECSEQAVATVEQQLAQLTEDTKSRAAAVTRALSAAAGIVGTFALPTIGVPKEVEESRCFSCCSP